MVTECKVSWLMPTRNAPSGAESQRTLRLAKRNCNRCGQPAAAMLT